MNLARQQRSPGRSWRAQAAVWCALGLACTATGFAQNGTDVPASINQLGNGSGRRPLAPSATALTVVPEDFARARIAPGYLLQMEIYNVPEMSSDLRVNEEGDLTIPLLGPVHVGGETVSEAQATIAKALVSQQILKAPQVTLNVVEYAASNVTVLGEVQSPGRIQILAPRNLADVLALAGGETIAAGNDIEIRHSAASEPAVTHVHYAQGSSPDALRSSTIYPGDSVFVQRAGIIYVLGAVNRPGGYLMVNGGSLNVLQAIAVASGMTNTSATGRIRIIRPGDDGKYGEVDVPYAKVAKGKIPPTQLQAQDILYVPTSMAKSILINGSGIVSTTASAAIYRVP